MSELDALENFCADLEAEGVDRVVARWIDEKRPVDENDEVAIRKVTEVTLKAAINGAVTTRTFEDIPFEKVRSVLAPYEFEVLYRNDNLTRR